MAVMLDLTIYWSALLSITVVFFYLHVFTLLIDEKTLRISDIYLTILSGPFVISYKWM